MVFKRTIKVDRNELLEQNNQIALKYEKNDGRKNISIREEASWRELKKRKRENWRMAEENDGGTG